MTIGKAPEGEMLPRSGENPPSAAPGKTVAILQSNYIPWKGYFDVIRAVDEFILYDEVQYTRRDWRNRNRIKTPSGGQWLTIPVKVSGRYTQKISETRIADPDWASQHWITLLRSYRHAACFDEIAPLLEKCYREATSDRLSEINESMLRFVCGMLGISTLIRRSTEFDLSAGDPTARLVSICLQAGANRYVSGPAAKAYLDETQFRAAKIELVWMSYEGYPTYPQLHGDFEHHVSVLDLLLNTGARARQYLLP